MARVVSEIDRLIEEGLSLYGEGDLDGALLLWERVLVIDPENAQANSYVDYVRMNYELLTSDNSSEDSGPFGIDSDEPEYQIEISPGEGGEPAAPLFMDDREHGWGITDDSTAGPLPQPGSLTLELEADEPPVAGPPGTFAAPRGADEGDDISFEDATREYPGGAGRPTNALLGYDQPTGEAPEFNEVTPGFGSAEDLQTPQSFASQPTELRRREFGFVRPSPPERSAGTSADSGPPELKMTLRTPGSTRPPGGSAPALSIAPVGPPPVDLDPHRAPTADGIGARDHGSSDDDDDAITDVGAGRSLELDLATPPAGTDLASAYASLELDLPALPEPQIEDLPSRTETRRSIDDADGAESDLVASLPTPRPPGASTRPMPGKTRPPAFDPIAGLSGAGGPSAKVAAAATHLATHVSTGAATDPGDDRPTRDLTLEPTEPALKPGAAPTQELPYAMALDPRAPGGLAVHPDPQLAPTTSHDFADKPTNQIAARQIVRPPAPRPGDDSMITAPTRELGLRELALRPDRPLAGPANPGRANTEDETTGQVDVSRARPLRGNGKADVAAPVPGMDPIDARSAEILEQIDRGAPAIETREERTRRRITALLDRAAAWGRDSDVDRAVTAVDLALSEDPNSALAQKLIHRNREAIMNAFQAFLGDLQRTPSLARPLHELGSAPISPRAAFLLSRVDGTLSLDEILDVSGMPRLEAYRYLCQLFLRGILR
jgi:hypothetical protein